MSISPSDLIIRLSKKDTLANLESMNDKMYLFEFVKGREWKIIYDRFNVGNVELFPLGEKTIIRFLDYDDILNLPMSQNDRLVMFEIYIERVKKYFLDLKLIDNVKPWEFIENKGKDREILKLYWDDLPYGEIDNIYTHASGYSNKRICFLRKKYGVEWVPYRRKTGT